MKSGGSYESRDGQRVRVASDASIATDQVEAGAASATETPQGEQPARPRKQRKD